jgi:hypothetical protein
MGRPFGAGSIFDVSMSANENGPNLWLSGPPTTKSARRSNEGDGMRYRCSFSLISGNSVLSATTLIVVSVSPRLSYFRDYGEIIMTRLEPHYSRLEKAFAEPSKQIEPMASHDDAFDGAHDLILPVGLLSAVTATNCGQAVMTRR